MKKFVLGFAAAFVLGLGATAVHAEGIGIEDAVDECQLAYTFGGGEFTLQDLKECRAAK